MLRHLANTLKLSTRLVTIRLASSNAKSAQQLLKIKNENGVREITLSDSRTRNSLSMDMMCALQEALLKDSNDLKLRCIVLTAEGKVWSAGHNLKELHGSSVELWDAVFQKMNDIILDIHTLPVPVIAKVNGVAAAAGCQLAASCDIIVASENSTFSTPGGSVGIFCHTPGVAVARVMTRPKSAYMLMTGLPISSQEAYAAGMLTKVVPEMDLDSEIAEITDAIKAKSRAVISLGKRFYYKQLNMPINEALEKAKDKMVENLQMEDSSEGIASFIEKRSPNWKHTK